MDTNQIANDLRIFSDETVSEIWCGVPEKCQNFSRLSMFLSNSSAESYLVLSGNMKNLIFLLLTVTRTHLLTD